MSRVLACAWREYKATAGTKAFLLGTFGVPVLITGILIVAVGSNLFEKGARTVEGEIVVIDATEERFVSTGLETFFSEEVQRELMEEKKAEARKELAKKVPEGMASDAEIEQGVAFIAPQVLMDVNVRRVASEGGAIEAEKEKLKINGGPLALIVVNERALESRDSAQEDVLAEAKKSGEDVDDRLRALPGHYALYHRPTLDHERVGDIMNEVDRLIVDERLIRTGHEVDVVREMMLHPRTVSRSVSEEGEIRSGGAAAVQELMPIAFLMLLWISVFTSGQYLLMSTVEEKSSRVIEVLLSAISPMQIMLGKIMGQGAIGLTILLVYGGVGLFTASTFKFLGMIPLESLGWLLLYFVMAYGVVASMMAAIGSAVNDVREASALMTPVMMVLVIPMILWMPISQNPMGLFARTMSFVPPMTPFVMVVRVGQPGIEIPMWEMIATGFAGLLGVVFMVWAAKKIFRVGILMYGQPPSVMGLIKWLRYA